MSGRALFDRFPRLAESIPWIPLGTGATPLEWLELQTRTGPRRILVKRDDLTGSPYGGNKVRKLEFILAEADRRGARRLITAGAAGSHHALATALYGTGHGLPVTLVLFPQSLNDHVRDIVLMDHGTGAELRWVRRMEMVPLGIAAMRVRHVHERPFVIAPGGSDAVGTLGYVDAGLELAGQIGEVARPSAIHVAAGTLGTAAGLAIGLALAGASIPIRATRITSRIVTNERALRGLVEGTLSILRTGGVDVPASDDVLAMIELCHDQIGRGYGRATEASRSATEIFGAAGITLDPTYTAKAAADLLETGEGAGPPLFMLTLSSTEPRHLLQAADPATLPPAFRRYLSAHSPLP